MLVTGKTLSLLLTDYIRVVITNSLDVFLYFCRIKNGHFFLITGRRSSSEDICRTRSEIFKRDLKIVFCNLLKNPNQSVLTLVLLYTSAKPNKKKEIIEVRLNLIAYF